MTAVVRSLPSPSAPIPSRRGLVILGAVLFTLSSTFPLAAGLAGGGPPPAWLGPLDVAFAVGLLLTLGRIATVGRKQIDSSALLLSARIYRWLANLPLVLITSFFLFESRIKWDVLLVGLAWRTWALMYVLPAALAVWGGIETDASSSETNGSDLSLTLRTRQRGPESLA